MPDAGLAVRARRRALAGVARASELNPAVMRLVRRRGHRQRVEFYARFVSPGDLVFDVGAHVGNRTDVFVELGATVVAVEPQPSCARQLVKRHGRGGRVHVLEKGLAETSGSREMRLSSASTLATMSDDWVSATSERFAGYGWQGRRQVEVTTLDELVEQYGVPRFCKIDVEGYEERVLAGLSRPLGVVSFEWVPELPDKTAACLERLEQLGATRFSYSVGESYRLELEPWVSAEELFKALPTAGSPFGDVYADFTA